MSSKVSILSKNGNAYVKTQYWSRAGAGRTKGSKKQWAIRTTANNRRNVAEAETRRENLRRELLRGFLLGEVPAPAV